MLIRLVAWWFAAALMALAVTTAMDRHRRTDVDRRAMDFAAAIVAADWAAAFEPSLEPNQAVDAMPGLSSLVATLVDPHLGVVAAGIALPSGELVAARGSPRSLTGLAASAAANAQSDADTGDGLHPAPGSIATALDGATRIVWTPLVDWTGLTRARLALAYRVGSVDAAGSNGWPWRARDLFASLGVAAALLVFLGRSGWRSLGPIERKWLPVGLLASLLLASALVTAARESGPLGSRAGDMILSLDRRPGTSAPTWAVQELHSLPVSLCNRLQRIGQTVSGFGCAGAGPIAAKLHDSQPRRSPDARLAVQLRDAAWQDGVWCGLLASGLVAVLASLAVAECLPAAVPGAWRRAAAASGDDATAGADGAAPDPLRDLDRVHLFLLAFAVAGCWPALAFAEPASVVSLASLAGAEAIAAICGMGLAAHFAARHGWRFVALPAEICGLGGAAGLSATQGALGSMLCWAAVGLGSAAAATALAMEVRRREAAIDPWQPLTGRAVAWTSGGLAGLASGALAVMSGGGKGSLAFAILVWFCATLLTASCRNDAAAPLRHAVSCDGRRPGFRSFLDGILTVRSGAVAVVPALLFLDLLQWLAAALIPMLDLGRDSAHGFSIGLTIG